MQQPNALPEQMGSQQQLLPQPMMQQLQQMVPQQMMFCPVVYNPMLMQPGDRMQQPNQNFIINQPNTPPWARPIQNHVIYVQQLPPNIVQNNMVSMQQLDPNQMYIQQNFSNFQQIVPQVIGQNPQDQIRTVPMIQNFVPNNIVPNIVSTNNMTPQNITQQNIQLQNLPNNVIGNVVPSNIMQRNVIHNMVANNAGNNNRVPSNIVSNNVAQANVIPNNASTNSQMSGIQGTAIQANIPQPNMGVHVRYIPTAPMAVSQGQLQPTTSVSIANTSKMENNVANKTENRRIINPLVSRNSMISQSTMTHKSVGLQTQNIYRNSASLNTVRHQQPMSQAQNVNHFQNTQVAQQINTNTIVPNQGLIVPNQGQIAPNQGQIVPNQGQNVPNQGQNVPNQGQNVPNQGQMVPNQGQMAPNQGQMAPNQGQMAPNQGQMPPNQGQMPPNQGQMVPNQGQMVPNQGQMVPNQGQNAPNQGQTVPNQVQIAPNPGQIGPNQGQIVPNQGQILPNQGPIVPSQGQIVPNQGQVVPNQAQILPNMAQNITLNEPRATSTYTNTENTVTYSAVRNGQPYSFRAIQPKPPQYRPVFAPMQAHRPHMYNKYVMANTVQNNATRYVTPPPINLKTERSSPNLNKKRKSESPDELQSKMTSVPSSTIYGSMTVTAKVKDKIIAKTMNTSDMGTNTSPVHKPNDNSQYPIMQINPMEAKPKIEQQSNVQTNVPKLIKPQKEEPTPMDTSEQINEEKIKQMIEKEKLIRNTVFPQARGRVLNDKLGIPNNVNTIEENKNSPIENTTDVATNTAISIETQTPQEFHQDQTKILRELLSKSPGAENVNEIKAPNEDITPKPNDNIETAKPAQVTKLTQTVRIGAESPKDPETILKMNIIVTKPTEGETGEKINETPVNTSETPDEKPNVTETIKSNIPTDEIANSKKDINTEIKVEKKDYKNISDNDMNGHEIHIADGMIVKEEKGYVLTHVLDGYVIQESNVPFAIRKPLQEKTANMLIEDKQDLTALAKELNNADARSNLASSNNTVNINSESSNTGLDERIDLKEVKENIKEMSELNINEKKDLRENVRVCEKENRKDNPFADLKPNDVKTWTMEGLANHLLKYDWTETVAVLREHEIDGESLLLVSSAQLIHIGVSETHAETIYEFVSNKER